MVLRNPAKFFKCFSNSEKSHDQLLDCSVQITCHVMSRRKKLPRILDDRLHFIIKLSCLLHKTGVFKDSSRLHFSVSLTAVDIATTLTHPVRFKTSAINFKLGEFKSLWNIVKQTDRSDPLRFLKHMF